MEAYAILHLYVNIDEVGFSLTETGTGIVQRAVLHLDNVFSTTMPHLVLTALPICSPFWKQFTICLF